MKNGLIPNNQDWKLRFVAVKALNIFRKNSSLLAAFAKCYYFLGVEKLLTIILTFLCCLLLIDLFFLARLLQARL